MERRICGVVGTGCPHDGLEQIVPATMLDRRGEWPMQCLKCLFIGFSFASADMFRRSLGEAKVRQNVPKCPKTGSGRRPGGDLEKIWPRDGVPEVTWEKSGHGTASRRRLGKNPASGRRPGGDLRKIRARDGVPEAAWEKCGSGTGACMRLEKNPGLVALPPHLPEIFREPDRAGF